MSTPAWSKGELLRVCQPDLLVDCEWTDCRRGAEYEIELSVDGQWEAHRICPAHYKILTEPSAEPPE